MKARIACGVWPKRLEELVGPGAPFEGGFFCHTDLSGYSAVLLGELEQAVRAVEESLVEKPGGLPPDYEGIAIEIVPPGKPPNASLPVDPFAWTICLVVQTVELA